MTKKLMRTRLMMRPPTTTLLKMMGLPPQTPFIKSPPPVTWHACLKTHVECDELWPLPVAWVQGFLLQLPQFLLVFPEIWEPRLIVWPTQTTDHPWRIVLPLLVLQVLLLQLLSWELLPPNLPRGECTIWTRLCLTDHCFVLLVSGSKEISSLLPKPLVRRSKFPPLPQPQLPRQWFPPPGIKWVYNPSIANSGSFLFSSKFSLLSTCLARLFFLILR